MFLLLFAIYDSAIVTDFDGITCRECVRKQKFCDLSFDGLLDVSLKRASAVLGLVSILGDDIKGFIGNG